MTSEDFIRQVFSSHGTIYVDTSTLMNYESLSRFVDSYELTLMELRKKIYVSYVVWAELNRNLNSFDGEKQLRASQALTIICMHRKVFFIDDGYVDPEEMMQAFADPELLSCLTKNKTRCNQLLITNDKKLGHDALDLNDLESCQGYRIDVCHLMPSGDLVMTAPAPRKEGLPPVPEVIVKEVEKPVIISESEPGKGIWRLLSYSAALFGGFAIGKYGKEFYAFALKTVSRIR